MAKEAYNKVDKHNEENLKGSFVLVFVVGAVIIAMWFAVFYFYIKMIL